MIRFIGRVQVARRRTKYASEPNNPQGEKFAMNKSTYRCAVFIFTAISVLFINVNLFASEMDDRIETSAKQSYVFKTYLKGDDIKIQSQDGVVTLSGTVSEDSHILLAGETLTGLPGVKSFNNQLVVKSGLPAMNSDAWLGTKVKFILLFYRSLSGTEITVAAKDGAVTLRGKATSMAQKDLATEYAKDIEGVTSVNNEMTLPPVAEKAGSQTMGERMDAMGGSIDDASITALVKTTLLYHRSTSAVKTTVTTKDGVVTLAGKARNVAEKDLATKFVGDVHGVVKVINNMTVE
jgi:osmotically-inducible protein OsmY